MPVRFSLDLNAPDGTSRRESVAGNAARHSELASDPHRAGEILEKLLRIHARQAASGSPASHWDPLKVWSEMLRDCCGSGDSRV